MPLTVRQGQSAQPGRHSAGKGLYLLVRPSGSRSWVLRVRHKGRRQDFGLGSIAAEAIAVDIPLLRRSSLTLAEAREKSRIGRELARAGINPSAAWRVEEEQIPNFKEDAFDQVIRSGNSEIAELLRAMRAFLGENDMMAYLSMMGIRLIELQKSEVRQAPPATLSETVTCLNTSSASLQPPAPF